MPFSTAKNHDVESSKAWWGSESLKTKKVLVTWQLFRGYHVTSYGFLSRVVSFFGGTSTKRMDSVGQDLRCGLLC